MDPRDPHNLAYLEYYPRHLAYLEYSVLTS